MNVSMLEFQVLVRENSDPKDRLPKDPNAEALALFFRASRLSERSASVLALTAAMAQQGVSIKDWIPELAPLVGDVLADAARLCTLMGVPMSDVARQSIAELKEAQQPTPALPEPT
jgi:hypothetical protein